MNKAPKDPRVSVHPEHELYDIEDPEDPRPRPGATLLVINEGGCLISSPWRVGYRYWTYPPAIPKNAHDRERYTSRQNPHAPALVHG